MNKVIKPILYLILQLLYLYQFLSYFHNLPLFSIKSKLHENAVKKILKQSKI